MHRVRLVILSFLAISALALISYGAGVAAVEGVSQSTGNAGYLGSTTFGVRGNATGTSSGVIGVASSGTGVVGSSSRQGVAGYSSGNFDTPSAGVYGDCNLCPGIAGRSQAQTGVMGWTYGTLQNDSAFGVSGFAWNGSIGVFGHAPFPGWAGYFYGDLRVTGAVYQGIATAQIDNPTDPGNQLLNLGYLAASDHKTVQDGTVILDSSGEATVELPTWFNAMHEDFRYQLTPIGERADLYIAEEMNEGSFRIAGGYAAMKVSWQVTGVRRDPYALARPLIVEQLKQPNERGRLLHPEAYGRSRAEALDAERIRGAGRNLDFSSPSNQ
jgi:hypothetical protein